MKLSFNSPVILFCFFMSIIVYVINEYTIIDIKNLYFTASNINFLSHRYISFIFYIFGHADYEHFFNNFFIILLIGPLVEKYYGSFFLCMIIIFDAIVCAIIVVLFAHKSLCGSSIISFLLIGMLIVNNFVGCGDKILVTSILFFILYCFSDIIGLFTNDNISHVSHIISLMIGCVCGLLFSKKLNIDNGGFYDWKM